MTPQGTTGATSYTYQISAIDLFGGYGIAITGVSTATGNAAISGSTGWNQLSWTNGTASCVAIWRKKGAGAYAYVSSTCGTSYNDETPDASLPAVPAWISSTPPVAAQADWLEATIGNGGGTTALTLGAAATATVSGKTLLHSDTAAINAAIAAANAGGGLMQIAFPTGIYNAFAPQTAMIANMIYFVAQNGTGTAKLYSAADKALQWNASVWGGGVIGLAYDNSGPETNSFLDFNGSVYQLVNDIVLPVNSRIGTLAKFENSPSTILFDRLRGTVGNFGVPLFNWASTGGGGVRIVNSVAYPYTTAGNQTTGRHFISIGSGDGYDTIELYNNNFSIFDNLITGTSTASEGFNNTFMKSNIFNQFLAGPSISAVAAGISINFAFQNNWMSTLTGNCLVFSGAGKHEGHQITDNIMPLCGTGGIIYNGTGTNKGNRISGNHLLGTVAASGTTQISIAGGATYSDIIVTDNLPVQLPDDVTTGNAYTNGCSFLAAVDSGIFSGNDCKGATTDYSGMIAGTTTTFAHTKFQQKGNVNLADGSTSDIRTTGNMSVGSNAAPTSPNGFASFLKIRPSGAGTSSSVIVSDGTNNWEIGATSGLLDFIGSGFAMQLNYANSSATFGGAIIGASIATAGTVVAAVCLDSGGQFLNKTGGCGLGSGTATEHISYQPGLLTAVNATKAAFHKFSKASTVDNIEGSASAFTCAVNPTITVFECGISATCAAPTTIGTVTITAAGTVVDGTVSNAAIAAGDYVAFAQTGGTCASADLAATVQVHQN